LCDDAGVVANLLALGRDQQHVHAAARIRAGARVEDLVIQVDVLNVERDVLFGLPVDRLVELGLGHDRQRDLFDNHGVPRQRRAHILRLERLAAVEQASDGVGHRRRVDDRTVDDAVGGKRLGAERDDLESLSRRLQFDRLDGARTDVEADNGLGSSKHDFRFLRLRASGASA
jgi:hypothetical protein